MFPSLPKFADKAFVLGYLLPALIGTFSMLYVLKDLDVFRDLYGKATMINGLARLTKVALAMWFGAVILRICSHWLYRLLEGYTGPLNSRWWRRAHQARMLKMRRGLSSLKELLDNPSTPGEVKRARLADLRHLYATYPIDEGLVLPTRFGNAIRAFETYASEVYGVDPIPAWPRLQAVIPPPYLALLDDAKAVVDFFVNLHFIALAVAVASLAHGLLEIESHPQAFDISLDLTTPVVKCGLVLPAAFIASRVAYRGAIATAISWGELVKAAFDLYLPALATQLGYRLPGTSEARARFWNDVSSMFLYRQQLSPDDLRPAAPPAESREGEGGEKAGESDKEEKGGEEKSGEEKGAEGVDEKKDQVQEES
jgi:hypothetical protein